MESTHNYLIVSDFHLSEGRDPSTGLYHRNEDFFQDHAFAQFLAYHVSQRYAAGRPSGLDKPWQLVVNGDFFDFLQVISLPAEGAELASVAGVESYDDLSQNDREFGLGTSEKETVWKLEQIYRGHPLFFQALAWFLAHEGNELVMVKGNHDIEIYWPQVQVRMADILADAFTQWREDLASGTGDSPLPDLPETPEAMVAADAADVLRFPVLYHHLPGLAYVEHGCQYDPANAFVSFRDPRLPEEEGKERQIELPSGSFFVRYFFNRIEDTHPFADNIKPLSRYLFWLVSSSPGQFLGFANVLKQYITVRLLIRRKKLQKSSVEYDKDARCAPSLGSLHQQIQDELSASSRGATIRTVMGLIGILAGLLLLLGSIRAVAMGSPALTVAGFFFTAVVLVISRNYLRSLDHLFTEPYLFRAASCISAMLAARLKSGEQPVRYFVFGHDHAARLMALPEDEEGKQPYRQWYVNTGSWIPVFAEEMEQLERPAENLTFLRLIPDHITDDYDGDLPELLRWSQEANAPLPVRLLAPRAGR